MGLYERLQPLNLYALRQNSLIDCELAAYEVAFALLRSLLLEIKTQAFVQTATGESLCLHEELVGLQERPGLTEQTRRELVIYRRSVAPFDFSPAGMVNSMRAAGLEATIQEDYANERVKIITTRLIDDFVDLDSVQASLYSMLPAHLEVEFDIGFMTFDMFEAKDVTWTQWDAKDFAWDQFDIDGEKLF